jgi:hypothetical protein
MVRRCSSRPPETKRGQGGAGSREMHERTGGGGGGRTVEGAGDAGGGEDGAGRGCDETLIVYFPRIFIPVGFGDGRGFGVHPIPSNTLPQTSPK